MDSRSEETSEGQILTRKFLVGFILVRLLIFISLKIQIWMR